MLIAGMVTNDATGLVMNSDSCDVRHEVINSQPAIPDSIAYLQLAWDVSARRDMRAACGRGH